MTISPRFCMHCLPKYKEAGKTFETKVYDGAGHAFNNNNGPNYKPDAAKDAYEKSVAWFNKYLRS